MFNWIRKLGHRATNAMRSIRRLRAKYDSAQTSEDNRRHWANADGLSANVANSPEVRRTLRNRTRYEVDNNPVTKGIVLTLAHDLIGTGPRLQILSNNAGVNAVIEREFVAWAKAVHLARNLRTMSKARTTDGESFALLTTNPKLRTPVKLALRLLEAEQVATPTVNPFDANAVDGIEFDMWGNPEFYHVLREHPGGAGYFGAGREFDRVRAEHVVHYFRADRAGQARGVPDLTSALNQWAQLRRYTQATLDAAELAARIPLVLETEAPADEDSGTPVRPLDTFELERNMMTTLPVGSKLNQVRAEQPTTTYPEFKHEVLGDSARCVNMPFNIASGNSSGYNFASGRLDHQTYFKSLEVERGEFELTVLDVVFRAWLAEALLISGYLPDTIETINGDLDHQWFWDGREHVDPLKEANATEIRLATGQTSRPREYARQGLDYENEDESAARSLGMTVEEYRVGIATRLFGSTAEPVDGQDDGEDDEEPASEARGRGRRVNTRRMRKLLERLRAKGIRA